MDRRIIKELNELRHSPLRTVRNMREEFLHRYPRQLTTQLLPELYSGWLLHNLDLVPEQQQVEMYRFCKWLLLLAETQYILEERGA